MRQSSESFMDEMLKDNTPAAPQKDLSEQISEMIDQKMEKAFSKFQEQMQQVNPPDDEKVETPKETEDEKVIPESKEEGEV